MSLRRVRGGYPDQKLIEARFEISSLLMAGKEDLTEFFIRIESRSGRPLSITCPDLHELNAGPISVQDTDKTRPIGINLAGQYEFVTERA
jgi:hypothetical protein